MPGKIVLAEVGVLDGRLSQVLLNYRADLYLYMVDMWDVPYARYAESESQAAVMTADSTRKTRRHAELATCFALDRRAIRQGLSVEVAKTLEDGSLDAVFIDADHTDAGVTEDLEAWVPKVKRGGLIAGHDYGDGQWGVTAAVDRFFPERVETGADRVWWTWK